MVRRIFSEFLEGHGLFAIAEHLTRDGIPCPSAHDPARNRHRCGVAWSKSAIRAILTNPRYTGRQVWNRQRNDEVLIDVGGVALGHTTKQRWNEHDQWIFSERTVQPAIVSAESFAQAQDAYYRCRFPAEYALANEVRHPLNVFVRERDVVPALDAWLVQAFAPQRLAETIDAISDAQAGPRADSRAVAEAERAIEECVAKMTRYRAALTYEPSSHTVRAVTGIAGDHHGIMGRVRGGT